MTIYLKKIISSAAIAATLVSATPASAGYWWNWRQSGQPTDVKDFCADHVSSIQYQSNRLSSATSTASQARYAFAFDSHRKLRHANFKKCVRIIAHRNAAQSRK